MKISNAILYLFIIISNFLSNYTWANDILNFRSLTPEDGLSHINVTSIIQDKHGYIWIGTNNGLNQYDGFTVTNYFSDPLKENDLSSNRISSIYETSKGELWIGTRDAGLNKYISKAKGFQQFLGKGHNITAINEDTKGRIWFGELKKGLGVLEEGNAKFYQPLDEKIILSSIYNLDSQYLLLGTRGHGLYIFDQQKKTFSRANQLEKIEGLSIRSIVSYDNKILVATFDQLFIVSNDKHKIVDVSVLDTSKQLEAISSVFIDNQDIWVSTKRGLYKINKEGNETSVTPYRSNKQVLNSLVSDNINTVLVDKSNVLWVGTTSGSCYANLQCIGLSTVHLNELYKENVNVVFEDSYGQTWFGLKSGKLLKYKGMQVTEYGINTDQLNTYGGVEALHEDPYGNLWIGSWGGGLNVLSLKDELNGQPRFRKINSDQLTSNTITSIAFYDDALYVGTFRKGLNRLKITKNGKVVSVDHYWKRKNDDINLISNTINYLYVDPFEKCLWMTTPLGLAKIKKKGKKLTYKSYNTTNLNGQMSSSFCWEVYRSSRTDLWVGTIEKGLSKLKFDAKTLELKKIKTFTKEDGLASNSIQSLVFDPINNNLWIGGNGLTLFDVKTEKTHIFNHRDGIEGGYFRVNCAKLLSDGRICFASDKALNYIYPQGVQTNTSSSETIISSLHVFGKEVFEGDTINGNIILKTPIEETKAITLEYFQNNIEICFNAMHYGSAERNQYQYILEGFDKEWMLSDRRSVVYSNLPFGDYIFKVKSANSDGLWEDSPKELLVHIKTPWWRTYWAYLLYVVIICAVIYKINRMIIDRHKLEQMVELERFKMEKNEELTLMKIRFFVNISHELRTPLTLISSPLETLLKKEGLNDSMREYLQIMKRNSDRLLVLFDQLLDFRKIETGNHKVKFKKTDVVNFTRLVASSFNTLAKDNLINYSFHSSIDFKEVWIDEDIIEKVVYNLVSNSFKNTEEGGNISVGLSMSDDQKNYQITVLDTGKGISKEEQKHLFEEFYQTQNKTDRGTGLGLSLVKKLVDAHYGKITFESNQGEGSKFIVTLPLSENFMRETEKVFEKEVKELTQEKETTFEENTLPKVLIVEDNLDIALYLKKELQSEFNILLAQNGKEGYQKVVKQKPDIVISDIMMAEMNGIELCKEIKQNPHLNHIPVILLTAKSTDEDKLEGIESGADAYIVKPFKTEFLQAKVQNLIEERRSTKQFYASKKKVEQLQEDPEKDKFLTSAQSIVENNLLNEEFDSKVFATKMGLTYATLYNRLKKYENESATGYIRKIRLRRAAELIANSDHSIKEIQFLVGFNDAKYFRTNFKKHFEITPSEYLKKYRKINVKEQL